MLIPIFTSVARFGLNDKNCVLMAFTTKDGKMARENNIF
jgi:hypothetical protein